MKNLKDDKAVEGAVAAWALEYVIFTGTFIIGMPFLFIAPAVATFIFTVGMVGGSVTWLYAMYRVSQGKEALPVEKMEQWSESQKVKNDAQWAAVRSFLPKALRTLWKCIKIAVLCVIAFYAIGLVLLVTGVIV